MRMALTIRQTLAIARTEFRFSIRRSAPLVMTALICLLVAIGSLLFPLETFKEWSTRLLEMSPEQVENLASMGYSTEAFRDLAFRFALDWSTASGAAMTSSTIFLALVLLPIATAPVIPADRKFNVLEILRSTPIHGGIYLAGKILGVLALVFLVALVVFLAFLITLEILAYAYLRLFLTADGLFLFLKISLLDGLPVLACAAMLGVFTGTFFRTRRGALLPGFLVGLLSLFGWLKLFGAPASGVPKDVAAYFIFQNFRTAAMNTLFEINGLEGQGIMGADLPQVGIGQVFLMYGILLLFLAVFALLARRWLLWKEHF